MSGTVPAAGSRVALAVPGDATARTGGYIYDRRIGDALRARGWTVDVCALDASFPWPTPAALAAAAARLASLPDGTTVIIDSLALGAMPGVVERERARLRLVGLVHLPLGADPGLDAARAEEVRVRERPALAAMDLVVVTGAATRELLAPYDLPQARVVVVEPGTDRAPLARGSGSEAVHLVCVATLAEGKAHDLLLRALATVPRRTWRLTCAGSRTRDAATADRVQALVRDLSLEDRVTLAGDLDETALAALYHRADLFVLATRRETYGMAVAEALARGLPVVATATGAIPQLVRRSAGIVVPVDDVRSLAGALAVVIGDPAVRARLAAGARRVRDRLPTWEDAGARLAEVLTMTERDDVR